MEGSISSLDEILQFQAVYEESSAEDDKKARSDIYETV
jgi:hypothetical protein